MTVSRPIKSCQVVLWIWYHKYFRIVLWRTSDSYFQPKCGNCCNYKGCEPHGAWTGGSDYSACRVRPEILSAVDNDSAVCTRRCNDFGIRIDCNDRYQACRTAATYIPQHFNRWSCGCTWNGNHTVFRCTCKFSGMGDNGIWKITGCCHNNRGNFAKFDSSKRR